MRILDVSPRVTVPPERGSSTRTFNLLRHLSRDHEIRQFSQRRLRPPIEEHRTGEVRVNASYVEYRYRNRLAALVGEIAERSWLRAPVLSGASLALTQPAGLDCLLAWADVVLVEFPWQLRYCRARRRDIPVVLAAHNVEAAKFLSYAESVGVATRRTAWTRYIERTEARAVAAADLVLTVSAADRSDLIERYGVEPARVVEIPNGADTERYLPVPREAKAKLKSELGLPDRPTVVFAGADNGPNWAGLDWVRRLAARAPELTFLALGLVSRPRRDGNLIAPGFVPDFERYLQAADAALCPIEFGGGTKLKLLESLAAGLPTVAFAETLHGLELRDGVHVLVAERTEESLARQLMRLRQDADLAGGLGRSARAFVEERHDWRAIAAKLDVTVRELAETAVAREPFRPRRLPARAALEAALGARASGRPDATG